jgi:copper chaperone CopZ
MTHSYQISGMTCGSCVARVKSELLKLGDVLEANVQLESPQAVISMSKHVDTGRLQKAISNAGAYTIHEVSGNAGVLPHVEENQEKAGYYPIFLIFGYIGAGTLLVQWVSGHFDLMQWMSHFMAGFFLVFSFFKLLNLRAFAQSYQAYDIIARAVPAWGFVYPFVELVLGLLFLSGAYPLGTNVATFLIMSISTVGVVQSLLKKKAFQCACLGTIIKLPLSKVTLFEDVLMVVMSAVMIALIG